MNEAIIIREAAKKDAGKLLDIYSYYVEHTAISFEYEVPSTEEFESRMENTVKEYPYLVAEKKGELLGYAYASAFKMRKAYDWAAETTVYVDRFHKREGVGKQLYLALEERLKRLHVLNMNACIAYTDVEDKNLNNNSMRFHEHMGFTLAGRFHKCGYKCGKWYDMIWMEKIIGEHAEVPPERISFCNS